MAVEKESCKYEVQGLKWSVAPARVYDTGSFQDDDGKPMAYVKLEYFGGMTTIMIDPIQVVKFEPFKGKIVSAGGDLFVEKKKQGFSVKFGVTEVKPL